MKKKKCHAPNDINRSFEVTSMLFEETLSVLKKIQDFFAIQVILSCLGCFVFTLITVLNESIFSWSINNEKEFLIQIFNLYSSLMLKVKMNECVSITDVVIDLISAFGFASFHLIDFYSVASISTMVHKLVRRLKLLKFTISM